MTDPVSDVTLHPAADGPRLVRLLSRPGFEVFPAAGVDQRVAVLRPGAKVTVTCSPTRGIEPTLALTEQLAEQGFRVVPHIAARSVRSSAQLDAVCSRLAGLGVLEIFVIGGDATPIGPFKSALDLLRALADSGHPFERVGIAAYPEGHPSIGDAALLDALRAKSPLATYMVTQLCFDADVILSWVADVRRRGVTLPVQVGIPGVVRVRDLVRMSLRIGVGDSARFLAKHAGLAARLATPGRFNPDQLVTGLAGADGIDALHIYTFNQVEETERWRRGLLGAVRGDTTQPSPRYDG